MINIIVGTETGTAEYVADEIHALFEQNQLTADITLSPDITDIEKMTHCIVCTSTHGAGDIPQNLQSFVLSIQQNNPDLSHLQFVVIALGDSSYDTYCQAGKSVFSLFESHKANALIPLITIDAMDDELPEDIVLPYLINKIELFK